MASASPAIMTVKGKRADAEAELARLLNDAHKGTLIDQSKVTIAGYLRSWLDGKTDISGVTVERYTEIIENRIIPVLGDVELQKLKPKHVQDWLNGLSKSGAGATARVSDLAPFATAIGFCGALSSRQSS